MSNFLVALGVFLITVIGALFTVPYFIDWNGYRGVFEQEASRLLAREVRVRGAVNLHLLPTPYIRMEKVRIAETGEDPEESFFRADSLTVKLAVGPIFKGAIEANEVELNRPVLRLALDAKDGWNWQQFGHVLANAAYVPANIALTSVRISDGVVTVNGPDGAEKARIEGLDGEVSAPALEGPYRFRGTFGKGAGARELRVLTATPEAENGVRFKAALRYLRGGTNYTLDGRLLDLMGKPRIEGELSAQLPLAAIWPPEETRARAGQGRESAADADAAFDLKAVVKADAGGARLAELTLSFERGGRPQLLTGAVEAQWRQAVTVKIDLASRWLDLDRIAGAEAGAGPLKSLTPLALKLRELLPANGSRAHFAIERATVGGDVVAAVRVGLRRSKDQLEIENFELAMPGGSHGELTGVVAGPPEALQLNGSLGIRGTSVVRFLTWATGNGLAADGRSDGAFALRSGLLVAPGRAALEELIGDLSGTTLYGRAEYRWGERPQLALALEGPQIDARAFVPPGWGLIAALDRLGVKPDAGDLAAAGRGLAMDARLQLAAGQLITAGRSYRDVMLNLEYRGGRLNVPQLRIAGDEGYSLELEGEVEDVLSRPKGTLRLALSADTAAAIAPLAELFEVPEAARPDERRAQAMAPLRLAGTLAFAARSPTSADLVLAGEANGARVHLDARLDGASAGWRQGPADVTGLIEGPEAASLVGALLPAGARQDAGRGRIAFRAGGVPAEGLATIARVEAGNASLALRAKVVLAAAGEEIAGDVEVKDLDAARLAAMLPIALPLEGNRTLSGTASFRTAADSVDIDRFALQLRNDEIRGRLSLMTAGSRRRIEATIDVDKLALDDLASPILDRRFALTRAAAAAVGGEGSLWSDDAFVLSGLDALDGHLTVRAKRLALTDDIALNGATLEVALEGGKLEVRQLSGEEFGGRFNATLTLEKLTAGLAVAGQARFEGRLEGLDGRPAKAEGPVGIALEFSGRGASPRALVGVLRGKGQIEFGNAHLANLWPGAVGAAVDAALKVDAGQMGSALAQALRAALDRGTLPLGPKSFDLDVLDGRVHSAALAFASPEGQTSGSFALDLRTLTYDSEWRLEQSAPAGAGERALLPAAVVSYRGPLTQIAKLSPQFNTEALERELTVRRMERQVEELERLRRADEERRREESSRAPRPQLPRSERPGPPAATTPFAPAAVPRPQQPATPG
jgi:uncharacterized protein involved in outer membrane biogenesis